MKHIYLIFAFGLLLLTACNKANTEDIEIVPVVPSQGYILFNAETPTRGSLVTEMNKSFGVMGYQWVHNTQNDIWNTVKVTAKPTLFHGQKIKYENGAHSYDPLKPWATDSKYAFFGYYPHQDDSDGTLKVSESNVEGVPYLVYTLPSDANQMKDVMTASLIDTDYKSSREVNLTFKHRLAAVDLQMVNINTKFNGKGVVVKLTDLEVELQNIKYSSVTIPMDAAIPMSRVAFQSQQTQTYALADAIDVMPSDLASSTFNIYTSGNPLILIPQDNEKGADTSLKGTIKFTLNYYYTDGNKIEVEDVPADEEPFIGGDHSHEFDFEDVDLLEGRKHIIQLTFTRNAVSVQVIPPGEWTDQDVDIEFE